MGTLAMGTRAVLRSLVVLCGLSVVGLVSRPAPACSPSSTEAGLGAERDLIVFAGLAAPEVGEITWTINKSSAGCGGGVDDCSFGSIEIEILYDKFDYAALDGPDLHYTRYFRPASRGASASKIELGSEQAQWFRESGGEIELSVVVDTRRSEPVRVVIPPAPIDG